MTDDDFKGIETGRITIRRVITAQDGETGDLVFTDLDGDANHALTALGMLAMAIDAVHHKGDFEEDE